MIEDPKPTEETAEVSRKLVIEDEAEKDTPEVTPGSEVKNAINSIDLTDEEEEVRKPITLAQLNLNDDDEDDDRTPKNTN